MKIQYAVSLFILLLPFSVRTVQAQTFYDTKPIPVKTVREGGKWTLLRGGKPYLIHSGGGGDTMIALKKAGGNAIRTWGTETLIRNLETAQLLDMTVCAGIWLGHKEHGFRYDDPKMLAEQKANVRRDVLKYRNHPNLLVWALGNEMEGEGKDDNVWKHIEDLAKMVRELDPNHPVMTVIAEMGENGIKAKKIAELCPSIDILGVNSYAGVHSLPERLKAAGWTKPYIITEFGPAGWWEVGKTAWGAPIEQNSTQKAKTYAENYRKAVTEQSGWCLGSFAFLWGDKMEQTPTWFSMFLPETGEKLGPVDVMSEAWAGKKAENPVPEITSFDSSLNLKEIESGAKSTATCIARSPMGAPLHYRYEIRPEDNKPASTLPGQVAPSAVEGIVPPTSASGSISFTAPTRPGAYRLYVYIYDGKGGAATGNLPFRVK
jgi:hypothetical protein